ncbi:MAG: LLM class flavin-dependent oxidoreductase [Chloroflexota bacterium]
MTAVSFGLFDWIDASGAPLATLYEERLRLLEAAEAAGFYAYHLAEHHGTPLGMAPSPGLFLAAAAQRTRRIRLGPLVHILPLYNPLRLLEEICMLDHLSGGRLELGLGRGISPYELGYFGVNDEPTTRSLFEESLAVILRGLTQDRLSFEGDHYRFQDVPMTLKPLQRPYPPLWYPSQTPGSVPRLARDGFNYVRLGPASMARDPFAEYWRIWEEHRGDANRLNGHVARPRVGLVRQVVVAETDAEAAALTERAYGVWNRAILKVWHEHDDHSRDAQFSYENALKHETVLSGSPTTVRAQMARMLEESGCNYVLCVFAWGDLSHEDAMRSLRLFAGEVMPAFAGGA